jgi:poly(A) polymerase
MAAPARQWGVTPPISTVLPTQDELAANDDLIAELKAQNNFEPPSETERRCVDHNPERLGTLQS